METTITTPDGEQFFLAKGEPVLIKGQPVPYVMTPDDAVQEVKMQASLAVTEEAPPTLTDFPLEDLAEERLFAQERVAKFRRLIEQATMYAQAIDAELYRRMSVKEATALPSEAYDISYERKRELVKDELAFREVQALHDIPQKERDEICSLHQPPPVLKTDAAALKKYTKKYGGSLRLIAERALKYVDGPIRVTVKRKQEVLTTDEF